MSEGEETQMKIMYKIPVHATSSMQSGTTVVEHTEEGQGCSQNKGDIILLLNLCTNNGRFFYAMYGR